MSGPAITGQADIFFYVQHLLGIGHLHRAALIAKALDRAGLEVVFVSGGVPVPGLDIGGARLVQLPPLRTADLGFTGLMDEHGQPIDETWRNRRRDRLLVLFDQVRPKIVLLEMFPFGRRQLRFELIPLIEAARARSPRPLIVSSIRDILNPQEKPEKTAWIVDAAGRYLDRVLVHGDPAFLPLERSFPEAAEIAELLEYTGYVAPDPEPTTGPGPGDREVLVSTGGGAVAGPLIDAALEARPLSVFADRPWRILAGPNLPDSLFEAFRARAPEGVIVERARPDFSALLRRCRLSISQAGYNTVMEVLAAGATAVVVPFAGEGEGEQGLRAAHLAERGQLTVVEEAGLDGPSLAAGIAAAVAQEAAGPRGSLKLGLNGAERTAEILARLLAIVPP